MSAFNNEEAQRLTAALEQLEAEQRRREDEKIAAGEAIRLPLHCVVAPGGDADKLVEEAKAHKIAAACADGETREIVFEEPMVLVTGVPRGGEFGKWEQREPLLAQYPDRYAAADRPAATAPKPAPVNSAALEWKPVRATVTPPSERDMGMIIEARYAIAGGELRLDFQGKLYAETLGPNDDALHVARRLLRSKYGRHEEFYGRINYPPRSLH
jgi:hypothetical protein